MSICYSEVLSEMYAGLEWSMSNEDYSTLVWLSDTPKPTQKDLDDKKITAQDAINARHAKSIADKAAAEAKLAALGLTADDLKALGL